MHVPDFDATGLSDSVRLRVHCAVSVYKNAHLPQPLNSFRCRLLAARLDTMPSAIFISELCNRETVAIRFIDDLRVL